MAVYVPAQIAASLDPQRGAQLKSLTSAPPVAWPTVLTSALMTAIYIASIVLAVQGHIPLWVGMLVNGAIGYLTFTVVHDALHRSISTNTRLNDVIGQSAVLMITPYVDLRLFRWGHVLHHRFTSGTKDPDYILHGAWWTLPFRWMAIDALYLVHALRQGDKISAKYLKSSMAMAVLTFSVAGVLTWMGYGWEVLMLWFIPSRLIFLALGFSFFWLPHVPHDTTQEENFTKATTVRPGMEWLMAPLLQNHHVHLIHHLYPGTPFYNNAKVWKLIEPELRARDLAIQHGFAINPVIYAAREGAA
ncbi:fatty acid desaturase [Panacagrimonas sp.]|uniref:fatty acid desaturase n=1 Tax=Panacagrimonas sp. TaxID=2480088 RepID=UPI003B528ED7